MKVDLYPSAINNGKFLAVPTGTNLTSWPAPPDFDQDLTKVYALQNTLDIQATDVGRVALNPADVIDQINKKGWALVTVKITVTVAKP